MADDLNTQTPNDSSYGGNDPISAYRKMYNPKTSTDADIYTHLSDPNNYRAAFGSKTSSDEDIVSHMQKVGLSRPDLSAPPKLNTYKPPQMKMELNSGYATPNDLTESDTNHPLPADPTKSDNTPGILKRLAQSAGLPTNQAELNQAAKGPSLDEAIGGPAVTAAKGAYHYGKRVINTFGEGVNEAKEAGQNIAEGQPVLPNILKGVVSPAAKVSMSAVPVVGEAANTVSSDVAGGNIRGAIGGGLGIAGQILAPELISRGLAAREAINLPPAEDAANEITRAINVPARERPNFSRSTEAQFKNIQDFAERNNLPFRTPKDFQRAAMGAKNETVDYLRTNIEEPHENVVTQVDPSFQGQKIGGEGNYATLKSMRQRLSDINKLEAPAYNHKGELMDTMTALQKLDLAKEHKILADQYHQKLSELTGYAPEQIKDLRVRSGQMGTLSGETDNAVNTRETKVDNRAEGTDVPKGWQEGVIRFVNNLRGGPEGAAGRRFRKATKHSGNLTSSELPPVPTPIAAATRSRVPNYVANPVEPTNLSTQTTSPEEIASQQQSMQQRIVQRNRANVIGKGAQNSPPTTSSDEALGKIPPTRPTGAALTDVPFSYPYMQGEELGELARETTAGSKQARQKFYSSNPSALDKIPPTTDATAEGVKNTPKPPPAKANPSALGKIGEAAESAKKAEVERLRKRLKELDKKSGK